MKLAAYFRSVGKIVLICASTALAAQNYPNEGVAAHYLFHLPVIDENVKEVDDGIIQDGDGAAVAGDGAAVTYAPGSVPSFLSDRFHGSRRNLKKKAINALHLVSNYGKASCFLTVTCNSWWRLCRRGRRLMIIL